MRKITPLQPPSDPPDPSNPSPTGPGPGQKLLYFIPLSPFDVESNIKQSDLLLLLPENGFNGTVFALSKLARTSDSLKIPYRSMFQPALHQSLTKALSDGFRAEILTEGKRNIFKAETSLTNDHHLFQSWLQYFRVKTLNLSVLDLCRQIDLHYQSWYRWERAGRQLPSQDWFNYLWKWWEANLTHPKTPWADIITPGEQRKLKQKTSPRHQARQQLLLLTKETSNDRT